MHIANDICSLDYLIGTLSTAYKGAVTSLAAKDFCMTDEGDSTLLKGTILSLPEGDYEASLIRRGVLLARAGLTKGYFELKSPSEQVREAKDLQIDILQSGRHIGTFLLKKEHPDGVYLPAVELSGELKGLDLKRLTAPLRGRIGLLQKAEGVVTKILSTKKDWPAFSGSLHSLATDLFWSARDVFYSSFDILIRFLLKAAEQTDETIGGKPVANFLDSIGLPLDHESDRMRLRTAVLAWLAELRGSNVDLAMQLRPATSILGSIYGQFPDIDISSVLYDFVRSLRKKNDSLPAWGRPLLDSLQHYLSNEEYGRLARFTDAGKRVRTELLIESERLVSSGSFREAISILDGLDADEFDEGKMISSFFGAAERNITAQSTDAFSSALRELFLLFPSPSSGTLAAMTTYAPMVIRKLISNSTADAGVSLLSAVARLDSPLREELSMNAETAAAVLHSGSDELIASYRDMLRHIVIPAAKVRGISSETWAELVNPLHLERLVKFMDLLQLGDERLQGLLVQVIANLFVSSVIIPDDRLFQRRVSAYLNSDAMKGNILLNYLFLQKLPVYYNEVGAVNRIRDYSTELDSWGNDPVLYFVRKQVHVNASNYNIQLIEKVISSWVYNDPVFIFEAVPADISAAYKPELLAQYSSVIKPLFLSLKVLDEEGLHFKKLLNVPEEQFQSQKEDGRIEEISAKVMLLCRLYREIVKKYSFIGGDFAGADLDAALSDVVDREGELSRVVRSPEKTAALESLYFKRHIAFGIPSVLGTYQEPKFDALGELLRSDGKIRVLLEQAITDIQKNEDGFSMSRAEKWLNLLAASYQVLKLHGLDNKEVEELAVIMKQNRLQLSQAADVLKHWQTELAWMVESLTRTFHGPLADILRRFPRTDLPEHLAHLDPDEPDFVNKAVDIVLRNVINAVPGLVEADRMVEQLLSVFTTRLGTFDEELNQDHPEESRQYVDLYGLTDEEAAALAPVLGNKAKNLVALHNRGFRVPPGVVFSALLTHGYENYTNSDEFAAALRRAVAGIEKRTGTVYGSAENPLFLSVRSGSYMSMPGILSTILYCGMNDETLQGFIQTSGDARLGWDSYRRFIEQYAAVVWNVDAGLFDKLMRDVLERRDIRELGNADVPVLQEIVERCLEELSRQGLAVPHDVYEQLRQAVRAIYASWSNERAEQFRRATRSSEKWGTSVTLMQMISGNAEGSGASAFFTRNPFTLEPGIYGETRENATGEDLVRGRRLNRPLAKDQVSEGQESLEKADPSLFQMHRDLAIKIEQAMGGLPQEVEATYTREPDGSRAIYVLQTRRMESSVESAAAFDEICSMESHIIGRGIGAHGGALSGVASFARSVEQAIHQEQKSNMPVILLRAEANTDDVSLMPVVRGIVTASGGVTSHAAVLAAKFGLVAVVACSDMVITTDEQGAPSARIGNSVIHEGDLISIDGATGLVFSGTCLHTTMTVRY